MKLNSGSLLWLQRPRLEAKVWKDLEGGYDYNFLSHGTKVAAMVSCMLHPSDCAVELSRVWLVHASGSETPQSKSAADVKEISVDANWMVFNPLC